MKPPKSGPYSYHLVMRLSVVLTSGSGSRKPGFKVKGLEMLVV